MLEGIDKLAFRSKQVTRLFDISLRQLDYWVRTGLVKPSILNSEGRGTTRVFNFRDLLQIRTVKALLDGGMSIQKIRKSVNYLEKKLQIELPLTARLVTDGDTIFQIVKNNKELIQAIDTLKHQGQGVFFVDVGKLKKEVEEKVGKLRKVA